MKKNKRFIYEGSKLPVKAEIVGEYLTKLSIKNDKITPTDLVEVARNPKNPLHKCFEWNDTAAAHKYRIEQARGILAAVKIEFISDNKPFITRAFVNIIDGDEQFYTPINMAVKNNDYMEYLYDEGKREFHRIKEKYATIKQFGKIFNEIDNLK